MLKVGEWAWFDWKKNNAYGGNIHKDNPCPLKVYLARDYNGDFEIDLDRQIIYGKDSFLRGTSGWAISKNCLYPLKPQSSFSMKPVNVIIKNSEEVFP